MITMSYLTKYLHWVEWTNQRHYLGQLSTCINRFLAANMNLATRFFLIIVLLNFCFVLTAQQNLVLNGNMDEIDFYKNRERSDWALFSQLDTTITEDPLDHPCHNVVTKYWSLQGTRGRFALHNESHSGSYYRQLEVFRRLDADNYEIGVDRAKLCKPLVKDNRYTVSLYVKSVMCNMLFDKFSIKISDSIYPDIQFIETANSSNYTNYYGENIHHFTTQFQYDVCYKLSFDYVAKGGETFVYMGYLDAVLPKKTKKIRHFKPDGITANLPYCIMAIDDLTLIAASDSEICTTEQPLLPTPIARLDTVPLVDTVYTIEGIYFDFDKWEVKLAASNTLGALVYTLQSNPTYLIELQGYADTTGDEAYNLKLSARRAEAVATYLSQKGIATRRIKSTGMGKLYTLQPDGLKRTVTYKIID
jgi:hypothetical protein